jgi:hypothetical protein
MHELTDEVTAHQVENKVRGKIWTPGYSTYQCGPCGGLKPAYRLSGLTTQRCASFLLIVAIAPLRKSYR